MKRCLSDCKLVQNVLLTVSNNLKNVIALDCTSKRNLLVTFSNVCCVLRNYISFMQVETTYTGEYDDTRNRALLIQ